MTQVTVKDSDWKFAALVYLHIELKEEAEELVHFEETCIRIYQPNDIGYPDAYVVEIYTQRECFEEITIAYHGMLHILNKFLDRLGLLTLNPCYLISALGITRFRVTTDEEFDLFIPVDAAIPQPKLKLSGSVEELIKEGKSTDKKELNEALREYRQGLESDSIYYLFLHHYNAIERIAEFLTDDFVYTTCPKCSASIKTSLKATGNKMKELFIAEGVDNKKFNQIRSIRGKIAHGAGERSEKLAKEVFDHLASVSRVAGNLISEYTGLKILYGKYPMIREQFILIKGVKTSERTEESNSAYGIISFKLRGEIMFNNLTDSAPHEEEEFRPLIGMPMDINPENFKIYPYSWPY